MQVSTTTSAPIDTHADTIAIGVFDGKEVAHDTPGGELQALLSAGEAKTRFKHLAVTHAEGKRWIVAGLGERERFDAERARVVAALVGDRARELGSSELCWELPHRCDDHVAGGFVEGTVLGAYRFERYKARAADDEPRGFGLLCISDHDDRAKAVAAAAIVAHATNAARDLQNTPANDMTPQALTARAQELAGSEQGVSCEVLGRDGIVAAGMGCFAAVAQGTYAEPQLITLRYEGPDAEGPVLGLVGKAVTFDSGGISLKPPAKMSEMKFDMSGGAAVIEAVGAIARLALPLRVVGVVGATENLPSGRSMKPGDIVQASNGTTVEIINTDAEGRLVLSDCLVHAQAQGAERLVDIATLTGGCVIALGSTYAGLMSNDDDWAESVAAAARASGELAWRLPLHEEYAESIKGRYADIMNAVENRKAAPITAAEFLARFAADVPWAHLDIAGMAWDSGKAHSAKGGNGFGVRLLVELARSMARR
jgi:leucyl aminopeptidase